eukprot:jgi/Undpi1/12041/HiC_scaffold_4.g01740.m1
MDHSSMSMDNDTSSMSMDHDHGDHTGTSMMDHHTPAPSTAMADMSGMSDMTADPFCNGDGAVMLMGFQSATKASVNCVLFLFEGAGVTSETKYAFAVIGVFLLGFANEMIRHGRDRMAKNSDGSFGNDLHRTVAFSIQMLLAYFLMLLVMLYEYVFLIAIILGLSGGHLVTLKLLASSKKRLEEAGDKAPPSGAASSGSPCCNTETTA